MLKPLTSYAYFTLSAAVLACPLLLTADEIADAELDNSATAAIFSFGSPTVPETKKSKREKQKPCNPDVRPYSVYVKHIEAKGIGYKKGYSTVGLFGTSSTFYGDFLPFIDLRGHVFNDGKFAANAGLGTRFLTEDLNMFGAGVYYDYREAKQSHYNQVSLSLEAFVFSRWEGRLNGYLPVGKKSHVKRTSEVTSYNFDHFAGHNLFYSVTEDVKQKARFAMWGADAEFGYQILEPSEDFTLYVGAGPYYYRHGEHRHEEHAWGGKVRIEARVTPYLVFEVSDSYDHIFHNRFQGQATFRIPFGTKIKKNRNGCKTACSDFLAMEARMVQPMYKQEIIVEHHNTRRFEETTDPIAISTRGVPLNFQFVNNTVAGGNGTFEHPFGTLAAASSVSTVGDVIYVFPGDNTSAGLNAGIKIFDEQQLLSSGIAQTVNILVDSTVQPITIPALSKTLPLLSNPAGSEVTLAGNNTVVSGFAINHTSAGGAGVAAATGVAQFQSMTIKNNVITLAPGTTGSGISCTDITGTNLIINNTITNQSATAALGIIFELDQDLNSFVTVQNNTVSGGSFANQGMEIRANAAAGSAELTAVVIGNNVHSSTFVGSALAITSLSLGQVEATVMGNTVSGVTGGALTFNSNSSGSLSATVSNNTLTGNSTSGIGITSNGVSTQFLNVTNNLITQNVLSGVVSAAGGTGRNDWIFRGNTIKNNGQFALNLGTGDTDADITIDGNILLKNTVGGLNLANTAAGSNCLKLTNNQNSDSYTITSLIPAPANFVLEPATGNTGSITLIANGTGGFIVVEPGSCAP